MPLKEAPRWNRKAAVLFQFESMLHFREPNMPDNKSKRGTADRRRIALGEPYEVGYFARKHRISRDKANAEAEKVARR